METILFTSGVYRLLFACIALVLVWGMLRILDKSSGQPFTSISNKIGNDSCAVAIYYGFRFIGACLLVGLTL